MKWLPLNAHKMRWLAHYLHDYRLELEQLNPRAELMDMKRY